MKHGWEYKKLGDVCEIYQPKTISSNMLVDNGKYPVYGANGIIGRYDQFNHPDKELLMTCRGATCGTINISLPYSWINGNAMVIHPLKNDIILDFLKYQLSALDLSVVITGAAQPQITRQSLSPLSISIPPIEEQKKICSLLDKMNRVIEAKKEQLKELDNLAQAIFYDMFGDPITNPKGWEMKKWESFGTIINGYAFNSTQFVEKGVPVLKIGNINTGLLKLENVSYYQYSDKLQRYEVHPNDVVLSLTGTAGKDDYGNVCIIPNVGVQTFYLNQRNAKLESKGMINNQVLKYIFACPSFKKELTKNTNGVRQGNILNNDIENLYLPLPPKSIQQSFADKIGAIERQKDLTNQSIREIQNLFDSRMDYYFGD